MKRTPTIRLDTSLLTYAVLADLESTIRDLPEIDENNFDAFYDLAVRAIASSGHLHLLSSGIQAMNIRGMTGSQSSTN